MPRAGETIDEWETDLDASVAADTSVLPQQESPDSNPKHSVFQTPPPSTRPEWEQYVSACILSSHFNQGDKIRHVGTNDIWEGMYNSYEKKIEHNGKLYSDWHQFAMKHNEETANGSHIVKCEYETEGLWVDVYTLPQRHFTKKQYSNFKK
jgi:hypothetical protein